MYGSSDDEYFECDTCTRQFTTRYSCCQHMNDTGHWAPTYECEMCTKTFRSQHAANQHMNAVDHWAPRFECETCTSTFRSESAANEHMRAAGHFKFYCQDCQRTFQNQNSLNMHLRSKVHIGDGVACPFCRNGFTTASGLAHHLERGSCPKAPNLNRETIIRKIRECDPHGRITNRQIAWHEEENVRYSATEHAFDGQFWRCYICKACFNNVNGLNNHINSPVHKQKVYHCPNLKSRCGKEFSTLAALFNHLESESCAVMRFETVQRGVNDMILRGRLIGA
ncbi:conserved hypothetical protein [Microsporum canis CBS 113480]|uniref:C2H2-type domain-containing protein n=1 Tax=Arthroderma otae (strain ATCC MYA-4605 / CBS 113480) TaxID=554155 RepID=C5FJD4_ARTOC|nr:conserved hypothetical protein [Microsporum canis CBS 113480]EEQ29555.1 conserved hypothetical protein [Microsporum canis CBS 113480]